jgi:hypothetical protein
MLKYINKEIYNANHNYKCSYRTTMERVKSNENI